MQSQSRFVITLALVACGFLFVQPDAAQEELSQVRSLKMKPARRIATAPRNEIIHVHEKFTLLRESQPMELFCPT